MNESPAATRSSRPEPHERNGFLAEHASLLIRSYRRWTGGDLVDPALSALEQARALWLAPFVVASHGTEPDPVLNYGNRAALALWQADWADFTSMPSRLTAEPVARAERARLLAQVSERGFMDDYSGVRIATNGRRFRIRRATVWNLVDTQGAPRGQAVTFREWEYLEATSVTS